jgi:hypothetical protein
MDELLPQDIDDVLQELEEDYGTKEPLPPEVEQLLQALQPPNFYVARQRAAKQLGTVSRSNQRVVHALVVLGETDLSVHQQRCHHRHHFECHTMGFLRGAHSAPDRPE